METPQDRETVVERENSALRWGIGIAVLALAVVAGMSLAYVSRERRQLNDLSATNQSLSSSVARLKTGNAGDGG